MVTVQGMSFVVGDLPLGENKEGDSAFCWQDAATDDAGSADFFDQFVVLDDHGPDHSPSPPFTGEEGGAHGGGGGGNESFESMCREALESSLSPPLTALSCPPLDHHPSAEQLLGDHENRASVAANNPASGRLGRFSSAKFPPQHRQVRAGSHVDLSNMDCQYSQQQQQHQLLVAGQREFNSILGTGYQEGPGSGGSISDSELLRLEGLTVNGSGSPRIHLPPLSASVPPSPHLQPGSASTSPRKSRLEAFYTKIRNKAANLHGNNKQKQQHPATTTAAPAVTSSMPSTIKGTSPNKMTARPRPHNLSLVGPEMPLSPPLTGQMTAEQNSSNDAHIFNTGFMDDPFMDISSNLSRPMHTPIQTPYQQHQSIPLLTTTTAGGDNSWQFSVSGPPPTTPAAQIVDGLSSSASELHPLYAGTLHDTGSNWWGQAVGDAMDTDPDPSSFFQLGTGAANTREATLNLQMALQQLQDQGGSFVDEHHFGLDTSGHGLVMHMPQSTSRVQLHQNQLNQSQAAEAAHAQAQAHAAAQLLLAQQQHLPDGLPSQHSSSSTSTATTTARSRRPKPRAPSSGASRLPSYQTSPRKVRAVSRSSRESSPTRGGSQHSSSGNLAVPDSVSGSGRQRLHRRSASMQNINHLSSSSSTSAGIGLGLMSPAAVRKRKSFTGRNGHASSVSMSAAGQRLSHAASHGDLGASASAFAKAIGASGHRVVPEISNGNGRLKSSSSAGSLANVSGSGNGSGGGRFTPLNGLPNSMNGFHGHPEMMGGYPPMPPLPSHLQGQSPTGLPHGLPSPHHHSHPSQHSQPIPMRSSSRPSPSKSNKPRSSSTHKSSNSQFQSSGGGSGGGGIGFVNFTPLDHHTLMSGVAPSGSSKTKARREREAAEQRRKLSEAMVKVVEAAGGDVRKLGELGELRGELSVDLGLDGGRVGEQFSSGGGHSGEGNLKGGWNGN